MQFSDKQDVLFPIVIVVGGEKTAGDFRRENVVSRLFHRLPLPLFRGTVINFFLVLLSSSLSRARCDEAAKSNSPIDS